MTKRAVLFLIWLLTAFLSFASCTAKGEATSLFSQGSKLGVISSSEMLGYEELNKEDGAKIVEYPDFDSLKVALSRGKCDAILLDTVGTEYISDGVLLRYERGIVCSAYNGELCEMLAKCFSDFVGEKKYGILLEEHLSGKTDYHFDGMSDTATNGALKLAVSPDAFPFSYKTEDGYSGADVQLAEYLCRRLGYSLVLYECDETATVDAVNGGKAGFTVSARPFGENSFSPLCEVLVGAYKEESLQR